ncbi:multiple coagulation factor deficiency protein 2 homolog [Amphiura filiformis]|uniref:multiple coagulation factor deficiency protein 2 homolog n=1 Tax=Amphiura filiformis TaxID=82378 RepID=UPI003B224219
MDFQLILCITTLATLLLALAQAQQQPPIVPNSQQQQGIHQMNQNTQRQHGNEFRNKQHIQDKDHIMEHLETIIDKPESEMSEQELQLHYFKLHDYDNNNKLDGLELIQALTHYHHDDDDHEGGDKKKKMTEKEMEELIDPILEEEDENGDGYIDYPEFAKTQS